ncbi:MAG: caspase family protein [Pseudomonadales bacterium]|nr:caspase family protein [Pseudomonadales bacterium]
MTLFLLSCTSTDEKSTVISPEHRVAQLHIVDCLLPGQVRMLGNKSYLTPRRPALLSASQCQIRGGEYVAFDRADYKTALKVWLPSAESGDAEAQANVGEIFERGLGGSPNYPAAIIWYKKSAIQGNKRAQFNLGTLYEQGLGVEKDTLIAMNYYRQAWGMPEDDLVYQSSVDAQQQALQQALNKTVAKKDQQINALLLQVKHMQKNQPSESLKQQIRSLKTVISDLQHSNKKDKQQLNIYQEAQKKRKLRTATVVKKNQPSFDDKAQARIKKDINFGKYYALIIGIDDYANMNDLDTPVNDIEDIGTLLRDKYGFQVNTVINADNISIMEAVNNLNAQLEEEDNLLIFYAGHGYRIQNPHLQSGYWLPSNADAPPRDTHWIANEFITRHLARFKARRILIVADSCYAGLLSDSPDFLLAGSQNNSEAFIRYKANKRSRLLLTSGGDEPVLDSLGGRHSIFADAFIQTLSENNQILTGPQLFKSVHAKVTQASKNTSLPQEPEYKAIKGAGHEIGEFFFIPK